MEINKGFLITRPRSDYLTNLIFHLCDDVLAVARSKKYRIYQLDAEKANKKLFDSYTRKNKPSVVFLNGHGNMNCVTGHNEEVILGVGDGDDSLPDAIVYARSCDAAVSLAPALIENGTKAFLGYKRKYYLASSMDRVSKPRDDKLAKRFIEPANLAVTAILKGNTVEEADKRSKFEMMKNVFSMLSSAATDEERSAAPLLYSNIKNQVIVGDKFATA